MNRLVAFIALVIAVCVGVIVGSWTTVRAGHPPFLPASGHSVLLGTNSSFIGNQVSFQNGFGPVVKKVLPAVVNIATSKIVRNDSTQNLTPFFSDPFFRDFFGNGFSQPFRAPRQQREHSLGSGVIIAPDGYILTNNHVVEGASDIKVSLADRRELKGTIVGTDPKTDLAVVRVSATGLPTIAMADSAKLQVGEFCLAIGDPFGVGETVTMGIVSAIGRGGLGIEDYEDFIQTDAAINPGNSGGPLVNVNGDIIGINTAILAGNSGGNQGVGFAIPSTMARQVTDQILKHGKVVRGSLGVIVEPVTPALAKAFALSGEPHGALVSQVQPGSAAERAGFKPGDIILQLNGEPVIDSRTLSLKIANMAPGTTVNLRIFRDHQEKDVSATLGELQPSAQKGGKSSGGNENSGPRLGVAIEPLTPDVAAQLQIPANTPGLVVTDVQSGSPAAEAGLHQGDVIQEVNRKPVRSAADFQQAIRQAGNQPVLLLIQRGKNHVYVVVEPQ
jgi:serine protease Do